MREVFLRLFNVSVTASWLVLAVLALRLILRRAPKSVRCLMWALVGLRLILPFSIESRASLVPSPEVITHETVEFSAAPTIHTGVRVFDNAVNPVISTRLAPTPGDSVNPLQVLTEIAGWVWLAGLIAMAGYFAVSSLLLRHRVRDAVRCEDGTYESVSVPSPFVFGFIRPRIYMPAGMDPRSRELVTAHERAHIKRRDYLIKPLAFCLLAVYWFNPVMWLAYVLLCRDIELACDERVLAKLGPESKKPYSEALLTAVTFHRSVAACPVAFGEGKLKARVKNVLSWKKPVIWITLASLVVCAVLAVCFLTDPRRDGDDISGRYVLTSPVNVNLGGDFAIILRPDGTMQYSEGYASSLIGEGRWELSEDKLTVREDAGWERTFLFDVRDGKLIFDAERSDKFTYVRLQDGAVFERDDGSGERATGPEGYYTYADGPGGEALPFFIRLNYGGTFVYYEAPYLSDFGDGLWTYEDGVVTMREVVSRRGDIHEFRFRFDGETLAYMAGESSKFSVEVPDGALFYRDSSERVYRPTGTYVHRDGSGRTDLTLTVNADLHRTADVTYTTSGGEQVTSRGTWSNTGRKRLQLICDGGVYNFEPTDGGLEYSAVEEGLLFMILEDGTALERVQSEKAPEATAPYRSEGAKYALEVLTDGTGTGRITDMESGATLWEREGVESYALWNPYNDNAVLLRQKGGLVAVDIEKGEAHDVRLREDQTATLAAYGAGWFGSDWLLLRTASDLAIYTLGDEYATKDGLMSELFARTASSDGAEADALGSALAAVFDWNDGLFIAAMYLEGGEVSDRVAELLAYEKSFGDTQEFRRTLAEYVSTDTGEAAMKILRALDALEGVGADSGVQPVLHGTGVQVRRPEFGGGYPGGQVSFTPLPDGTPREPLDEGSPLPVLTGEEFAGFEDLAIPTLSAWKVETPEREWENGDHRDWAESMARSLWGTCTVREEEERYTTYDADRVYFMTYYVSPGVDTEWGEYHEEVYASGIGEFGYKALWEDENKNPFKDAPATSIDEDLAAARRLADRLGFGDVVAGDPHLIEEPGYNWFYWYMPIDGMGVYNYRLDIYVTNGYAYDLWGIAPDVTFVTEDAPRYFLTPEQALYCVNYARSSLRADWTDCALLESPNPVRAYLKWFYGLEEELWFEGTDRESWHYGFDDSFRQVYYCFDFESDPIKDGDTTYTVTVTLYVDPFSGKMPMAVHEECYETPYDVPRNG